MAKKVNAQKVEARRLFEQDGFSLKDISEELGVKLNTLKTWKRRDNWIKNETETSRGSKKKTRSKGSKVSKIGSSPNSLENLIPAESGNKRALKHGLYSKFLNPKTNEILEIVQEQNKIENLSNNIDIHFANYIQAQSKLDPNDPVILNAEALSSRTLAGMVSDYENLSLINERRKQIQLDNELKAFELKRQKDLEEGKSNLNYRGLPIDVIAPVFTKLHFDVRSRNYREFVLPGGRGSTKSSFISLEIINLIEQNKDFHALVCRQIDKDLRDTVFNQLIWAIDKLGLTQDYKYTFKPLEITKISTGQKIYFTGLSDPTSVKSFTPTFGYVGILWFEELDQIRGDETVRKVQQSIVRGGDDFFIFKSFNPPRSKNNWANLYVQEPKESMNVYFSTYLDVPKEWLGEPFIQEAEYLKEINPEAYKNEYLGEANGSGGNILPNLVTREITEEEISHFDNIVNGLDFGWVHPSFFIRAQYDVAQQRVIVFDEICKSYLPNEKLAEEIKKHGIKPKDPIICDSAEPKSIRSLQDQELRALPAKKGPGSVEFGIKWLASQIEIVVDPKRTPMFYKQAINYEYERDKEGNITSLLPSIDDDGIAALRYALERFFTRKRSGVYAL